MTGMTLHPRSTAARVAPTLAGLAAPLILALSAAVHSETSTTEQSDASCSEQRQSDDGNEAPTPAEIEAEAVLIVIESTTKK